MSVANVIVGPGGVRLVTDTVSYFGRKPLRFVRKATARPAARLAFTVRGLHGVGRRLAEQSEDWGSFGAAVEDISATLIALPAALLDIGAEVTLAAWTGQPVCVRFLMRPGDAAPARFDMPPGVYLAPTLGPVDIPATVSDGQLVAIAHLQQEMAVKHGLNMAVGGDIELTVVHAHGAETRVIGAYPDKALMARRMAAQPAVSRPRRIA